MTVKTTQITILSSLPTKRMAHSEISRGTIVNLLEITHNEEGCFYLVEYFLTNSSERIVGYAPADQFKFG